MKWGDLVLELFFNRKTKTFIRLISLSLLATFSWQTVAWSAPGTDLAALISNTNVPFKPIPNQLDSFVPSSLGRIGESFARRQPPALLIAELLNGCYRKM